MNRRRPDPGGGDDQEIEFQEIEIMIRRSKGFIKYCIIVHEIKKALGTLGGHYLRVFSQT
jgi:hypothetical protein